ncbi:hypothetical protein RHSIM_Rhsim10G0208100 [Rhododendron simsii]|uniref:Uncharacterized protein n=1 Tax=Rhododendron simsii TaxID=118357 RepID=A0A834GAG5_RHOSS|nr:hypothetical protein RHSIM_Rhsim10G0208100 [Rhododendron simsii]
MGGEEMIDISTIERECFLWKISSGCLLDVTESVAATSLSPKKFTPHIFKVAEHSYSDLNSDKENAYDESYTKKSGTKSTSRNTSSVSSGQDLLSTRGSKWADEWHSDLLGCCSEPLLCMFRQFAFKLNDSRVCLPGEAVLLSLCQMYKNLLLFLSLWRPYRIASVATNRHIFSLYLTLVWTDFIIFNFICSSYNCGPIFRNIIRLIHSLSFSGREGVLTIFSHILCVVAVPLSKNGGKWRFEGLMVCRVHNALLHFFKTARFSLGPTKTKTSPPPTQYMES